jgi:hypothetical protein
MEDYHEGAVLKTYMEDLEKMVREVPRKWPHLVEIVKIIKGGSSRNITVV